MFASVAQLVEHVTENHSVVGSIPTGGTICGFSSFGRARPCQGRGGGFDPRNPLQKKRARNSCPNFFTRENQERKLRRERVDLVNIRRAPKASTIKRRHSQVVRQRSAKPLSPGSNPGVASKIKSPET